MLRAAVFAFLCLSAAGLATAAPSADDLAHARRLLAGTILFDGHNDLPWAIRTDQQFPNDVVKYDLRKATAGQTDIPRLREGGLGVQFYTSPESSRIASPRRSSGRSSACRRTAAW